jgi:O-succinylhomoserine sulfhydrylase
VSDDSHEFAGADGLGFDSRAVRAGQVRGPEGEHNDPIYATSSFVFASAAEAAARFAETSPGNVYSRFTNPTVRTFCERLAVLEGARHCTATSSGMSAILTLCLALLKSGDHVAASASVFGSTISLFHNILSRFGIEATWVGSTRPEEWQSAIGPRTRFLFIETPSNPLCEVTDIAALAALARSSGCLLVVDNVFCTPALQQPLALGADIVVHSATKYLDGQGRCVGGAVLCNDDDLAARFHGVLRTAGPAMSPFNAWVFLKGLETLRLRMEAHSRNAAILAAWLEGHSKVARVYHAGLPSHPHYELACRQQRGGGGVVSFEVHGGRNEAWKVIDCTRLLSITANLGDVKSTITHPASTTHGRISAEQRAAAGIREGLLRVAVGLEDVDDITADLARGLDRIEGPRTASAVA